MLDVHAPHETVHTWRDFFIHIATIVVGLCIAVGLEQTVEWLHHKSEVRETRQLLKQERSQNVELFHRNVYYSRRTGAELKNDLRIFQYLQQHPGTPFEQLPGVADWGLLTAGSSQASWMSAKQSNVLALMPRAEVEDSRQLYAYLSQNDDKEEALWQAIAKADAYLFLQPDPSKLTPAQVDAEVPLIQDCLRLTILEEVELHNIGDLFVDFSPGPSQAELEAFMPQPSFHPSKDFPAAWAFTQHDLESAAALDTADQPGILFANKISEWGDTHAQKAYEQVRAKYPDFKPQEDVLSSVGYTLMAKGEIPTATSTFQLNVQLYPNSSDAYESLGEAYAKAGNKPLAIENYQHALKLNPTASSSLLALKKLQQ